MSVKIGKTMRSLFFWIFFENNDTIFRLKQREMNLNINTNTHIKLNIRVHVYQEHCTKSFIWQWQLLIPVRTWYLCICMRNLVFSVRSEVSSCLRWRSSFCLPWTKGRFLDTFV